MATPKRRVADVEPDKGWHFQRTFSVDSLIQIAGIALVLGGPLLYWGRSLESRVLTLENFNAASLSADVRRDSDTREQRQQFNGRFDKFSGDIESLKIGVAQILARQAATPPPLPSPSQRR